MASRGHRNEADDMISDLRLCRGGAHLCFLLWQHNFCVMVKPGGTLSYHQTLQMRKIFIGRSCTLHFEASPLKIVRASRQYLYDDSGNEYLDCISSVSHVGHCHPHVVTAGQEQMARLSTSTGFLSDQMSEYAKRLISTMPESLNVCFFLNSGSEANDLAIRLARAYTKHEDVVCLDSAYHGNLGNLVEISPSRFKKLGSSHTKKDWVHIAPTPYQYRGKYRENTSNPGLLYANEVLAVIKHARNSGREIAAFICEPVLSTGGMIIYPQNYLQYAYRYVREVGGVCIADEVQSAFGRCGEYIWAFQTQDVIPDIVTVGKPIGNGYPLSAVITTKEIADSISVFSSTFGGNPVACAMGMAVLDVIENEKLLLSAQSVGRCLLEGFRSIMSSHPMIGEVRGIGLLVGIELVTDKESRKPASDVAEILAYRMKENKIIIANDGADKNVMIMTPPMCFTCDNARHVVQVFDQVLHEIENEAATTGLASSSFRSAGASGVGSLHVVTHIPQSDSEEDDDNDPASKRAKYEGVD